MKLNDKCRIVNDWLPAEAKKATVQVVGFQTNGEQYARVKWLGKQAFVFAKQWGTLFPIKELRAI